MLFPGSRTSHGETTVPLRLFIIKRIIYRYTHYTKHSTWFQGLLTSHLSALQTSNGCFRAILGKADFSFHIIIVLVPFFCSFFILICIYLFPFCPHKYPIRCPGDRTWLFLVLNTNNDQLKLRCISWNTRWKIRFAVCIDCKPAQRE